MSTGLLLCALSTGFFVFGFVETDFGLVIFLGTCLAGISKVIAVNSAFNMINEFDSRKQEFTLGVYYFFEKIIVGLVLYGLFS